MDTDSVTAGWGFSTPPPRMAAPRAEPRRHTQLGCNEVARTISHRES